jgi:hypothetical protein
MPAAMQEIAPAPGERLMSHDATKNASHVESSMKTRTFDAGFAIRVPKPAGG